MSYVIFEWTQKQFRTTSATLDGTDTIRNQIELNTFFSFAQLQKTKKSEPGTLFIDVEDSVIEVSADVSLELGSILGTSSCINLKILNRWTLF